MIGRVFPVAFLERDDRARSGGSKREFHLEFVLSWVVGVINGDRTDSYLRY